MTGEHTLRILDGATGREVDRCTGPAADGSCPRVAVGNVLPCAGCLLAPGVPDEDATPYDVSSQATLCPVTIAASLALTPDDLFRPPRWRPRPWPPSAENASRS